MQTIRLNIEALEIRSFATTRGPAVKNEAAPTDIGSAVSETNGVYICKSCGPCCNWTAAQRN
jgi:hypothetical protein